MGLLKKIFKPVSKVLDKIIPNELKPILPYAAAFAPYAMPGIMGIGGNTMLSRALMSGGLNIGAQLAQEGSEGDINLLSAGLGALQGAMTAPGSLSRSMHPTQGVVTHGTPGAAGILEAKAAGMQPGMMKSGLEALSKGSEFLTGAAETLQKNPFSVEGLKAAAIPFAQGTADVMYAEGQRDLKDLAKDVVDDMGGGYTDDAYRAAIRKSMTAYGATEEEIIDAIEAAGYRSGGRVGLAFGGIGAAIDNVKRNEMEEYYQTFGKDRFLSEAFDEYGGLLTKGEEFYDKVDEEIATGKFPEPEKLKGLTKEYDDLQDRAEITMDRYEDGFEGKLSEKDDIDRIKYYEDKEKELEKREDALNERDAEATLNNLDASEITRTPDFQAWLKLYEAKDPRAKSHPYHEEFELVLMSILPGRDESYLRATDYAAWKKNGGRINKANGGVPSVLPKGIEADYRGGGFIPIGSKERADDVPARLSENEFVMTADAVRAAGGGSVNRGAKRMYNLMHNLEARA
jgi:hypothetical protein